MKNTTRKNSMRKVSAVLAMAMAMSAAVSTMAVTASAHQYEACTCNCADNCTCDDTCDCEEHSEMGQPIPFTFQVNGRNGRVSDFHFRVSYKSAPLYPSSNLALIKQMHKNLVFKDGKLICYGGNLVIARSDGTYEYTIPGWADPSTIEIEAGYYGECASSNHNDIINYKFSSYHGKIGSIRLSTNSWTKAWGGYGISMELMVNDSTILRGVD